MGLDRFTAGALAVAAAASLAASAAGADTLVLSGRTENVMEVSHTRVFDVPPGGIRALTFRFAASGTFTGPTVEQEVGDRAIDFRPRPVSVDTETDRFGNTFTVATWSGLSARVRVRETYTVRLAVRLSDHKSAAPWPLPRSAVVPEAAPYLAGTDLVQSSSPRVRGLAAELTRGERTEQGAVMAILNWVVDNVAYTTPAPRYDALWTIGSGRGNCQNYSHLSMALLRASGIPARIVGGVSLGKAWKVPLEDGALLQTIGQGGHAWIEVWYPDLGWVPYDAQQSHLFVGPRHIKQTVGLDSDDVNDRWRSAPVLPIYSEEIGAEYRLDVVDFTLEKTVAVPRSYVMAPSLAAAAPAVPVPQPAPPPAPAGPVARKPEPSAAALTGKVTIGNLDFPRLMDFYVRGREGTGQKTFDKETAEYVTGPGAYAQAFAVDGTTTLDSVSLAMHRFGGRAGSLWVDVVRDSGGVPGMDGYRSMPVYLDELVYHPGYRWFDFRFPWPPGEGPALERGRYWVVLRHSRDAVVNWFYTPGNPYGGPDDTRSTTAGTDWSDVLNYDFNFRVTGSAVPAVPGPIGPEPR